MNDIRRQLVLSPRDFNERTEIVFDLPMTTASYHDANHSRLDSSAARESLLILIVDVFALINAAG